MGAEGGSESLPDALASGILLSLVSAEESTAGGGLSRFSNKLFEVVLFPAKTASVKLVTKNAAAQKAVARVKAFAVLAAVAKEPRPPEPPPIPRPPPSDF